MTRRVFKLPRLQKTLIIADDPFLLAQVIAIAAKRGTYLPVMDGPRILLPGVESEVIRRSNAAARAKVNRVVFAGLSDGSCSLFASHFPKHMTHRCENLEDARRLLAPDRRAPKGPLIWGRAKIGLGLLRALREQREVVFGDGEVSADPIHSATDHVILCEEGEDHAQVIAANYAYALGAGLQLFPKLPLEDARAIMEEFYSLYDARMESASSILMRLRDRLRDHVGRLQLPARASLTFITKHVPWGFAFGEVPATHLFSHPDLGIAIINGLAAEQPDAPGIRVATVIDPGQVDAEEVVVAIGCLRELGAFIRGLHAEGATVYSVSRLIELYPYDLLLISTHCGDAPGWRWTCEFTDSDGRTRVFVVDVAVGATAVPGDDKLDVTQFIHFVSLDGIAWNDPKKTEKLTVGPAVKDLMATIGTPSFLPTKREPIERVIGSAALRMHGGNYIAIPRSLASERTPIVINNACASWHRLALGFVFGNARAYLGTLFSVTESEAHAVIIPLFREHLGKSLAVALWRAQKEVYGDGARLPYVLVGCHFQRLRVTRSNAPLEIFRELSRAHQAWSHRSTQVPASDDTKQRAIDDHVRYLRQELEGIRKRWLQP